MSSADFNELNGTEGGELLIIFARYPVPGQAKTRLSPVLGAEKAAELQREMAEWAVSRAREFSREEPVRVEVRFAGGSAELMREWLGPGLDYVLQCEGDLGARMAGAFREAFARGAERVVLVGTDCPGITAGLLAESFDALRRFDLALGPAADGGYYLIGLRRSAPDRMCAPTTKLHICAHPLFEGILWGAGDVLERTLARARGRGLSVHTLQTLRDVDRPEDLAVWEETRALLRPPKRQSCEERETPPRPGVGAGATISIIIPALDEAAQIGECVSELCGVAGVEVIVSDGGSADGTQRLALAAGARAGLPCTNGTKQSNGTNVCRGNSYSCNSSLRVISAPRGRARQMNCGAAAAGGEILLFLHADTRLPAGFAEDVRRTLTQEGVAAGAFELGIEGADWRLRAVARLANARARRLQMPYGDQALFLAARTFRESGGFPEIALMEDFEFMRRLKRHGRIVIVPRAVRTSARRWQKRGVLRQTLLNQGLIAARLLGVSPDRLAGWYK